MRFGELGGDCDVLLGGKRLGRDRLGSGLDVRGRRETAGYGAIMNVDRAVQIKYAAGASMTRPTGIRSTSMGCLCLPWGTPSSAGQLHRCGSARAHTFARAHIFVIVSSVRRFLARPASVPLSATGRSCPYPCVVMRVESTPAATS